MRGQARNTPHRARPRHARRHPVHVTLRARCRSLRSQQVARTVLGALRDSNSARFRVIHYSVQENHIHLIVESESEGSLSTGMRSLAVRLAKRVNRLLFRRGRFWADRWHGHALKTPREVRNALVYVLKNRQKHTHSANSKDGAVSANSPHTSGLDPLSSAEHFDGFAQPLPRGFHSVGPPCVEPAQSWLMCIGWRRRGLIRLSESPKVA